MSIHVYIPDGIEYQSFKNLYGLPKGTSNFKAEELEILGLLIHHPDLSQYDVYQIRKGLKYYTNGGLKSTWMKQTQRHFEKLVEHGLIELVPMPETEHRRTKERKPFRLSFRGLIYFISTDLNQIHDETVKFLLENYGHNLLFDLFLYPYFNRDTLLKNENIQIFYHLYTYIKEICDILPHHCEKLNSLVYETDKNGCMVDSIFFWPLSPVLYDLTFDKTILKEYLRHAHAWDWISEANISSNYNINTISIKNPQHSQDVIELYIDTNGRKATLRLNGTIIDTFIIAVNTALADGELFVAVGKKTNQKRSHFLLEKLVLSFTSNIQSFLLNTREEMNKDNGTNILFRKDQKLMEAMNSLNLL